MAVVDAAVRGGHLATVKWLYKKGFDCTGRGTGHLAARLGRLEVLKWAARGSWWIPKTWPTTT
eukprot:CAMPEP_0198459010 /NCGR_PEP_ID=MMETSP1453-20131121/38715_1 /TAXON_ID=1461543 ORGANISM="Unidentified sp., Strain RCC701" /NCGR_SAMPLE_ID=MMETSP1453 /ASSEMBLY_ACC=CAM_ASM_001118 /LENGTH=62 /DNA_ID=CAMNT_0044183941 /DNA_START=36 /DNA_END=220 /DNA_ORIENTATION=-